MALYKDFNYSSKPQMSIVHALSLVFTVYTMNLLAVSLLTTCMHDHIGPLRVHMTMYALN